MSLIRAIAFLLLLASAAQAQGGKWNVYLNAMEAAALADIVSRHSAATLPSEVKTTTNRYGETSSVTAVTMDGDTTDSLLAVLMKERMDQDSIDKNAMLHSLFLYQRFERARLDYLRRGMREKLESPTR